MDVSRLLAEEDEAWAELCELIAAVPSDGFEEPRVGPDGWSARDIVFHIGAWAADCANQLEMMRMGTFRERHDTTQDIERMNREWFELSRTVDPGTARAELVSGRTRMRQQWALLPEATAVAWEWFEESGTLHYRKHMEDLRACAT